MKKLIKKENPSLEWLKTALQRLIYLIDNSADSDMRKNGEESLIKSIASLHKEGQFVLFDVGANRGDYTEFFLKYISSGDVRCHLFEPQQACLPVLRDKFGDDSRVIINSFGLSDVAGQEVLYKDAEQSGLASLYNRNLAHHDIKLDQKEHIMLQRASDYIAEKGIEKIDLLKMDVEGHELSVMNGFGDFIEKGRIGIIQFEYGGANLDSRTSLMELFSYFEKHQYTVCKVMRNHLEIKRYSPRLENFMYANYVAVSPEYMRKS